MKQETYPIEMSKEQMLDFKKLYDTSIQTFPFIPRSLSELYQKVSRIFRYGCFKHKITTSRFEYGETTEHICKKCSPKRYKMLKSKYEEVLY